MNTSGQFLALSKKHLHISRIFTSPTTFRYKTVTTDLPDDGCTAGCTESLDDEFSAWFQHQRRRLLASSPKLLLLHDASHERQGALGLATLTARRSFGAASAAGITTGIGAVVVVCICRVPLSTCCKHMGISKMFT